MNSSMLTPSNLLRIDPAATCAHIESAIRDMVFAKLRRKGAVIAISGGVDSSVVAALCSRALGKDRVLGLMLPESESSDDSLRLARVLANLLDIRTEVEDISPILKAAGCYERRDQAIRSVIPDYDVGFKCKIVLPDLHEGSSYPFFSVVVRSPAGVESKARLSYEGYLNVVAASNFKQRSRKMMEYYYADRYVYAVAGTPNRLEYDQGFFVKNGDGAADFKPIAHLYKTQVYQLAAYLEIPEEIQMRPPTTDTYSLDQSQEEFYFSLPLDKMDVCAYGKDRGIPAGEIGSAIGIEAVQVERVYRMIESKRKAAKYLHAAPLTI